MAEQGGDYPAVVVAEPPAAASVTVTENVVVNEQPAPVATEQPAALVATEQPAPVAIEQPAPVAEEQPAIVVDDYEQAINTHKPIEAEYGQLELTALGSSEGVQPPVETVVVPVAAAVEPAVVEAAEPAVVAAVEPQVVPDNVTVTFEEPPARTAKDEPAIVDVELFYNDTEQAPLVNVEPVGQPYHPPHEHYEQKRTTTTKKSSKKKPKGSRHIELMEWLPTLPQLFAYLGFTQFLLMFWVFVGECASDVGATWNLVMMWLTVVITTALYFVYNLLSAKKCPLRSLSATIFSFTATLFLFQFPILLSSADDSTGGRIVLALFRMLIIALVVVIFSVAYIEDLRSGPADPEPGEVVVSNGRAEAQPIPNPHPYPTTIGNDYAAE